MTNDEFYDHALLCVVNGLVANPNIQPSTSNEDYAKRAKQSLKRW